MPEAVRGTLLAFDFGEKRIGVATGETLLGSAHPLTVIHAESNDDRFAAIGKLIAEWQPVAQPKRAARIPNLLGEPGLGTDKPLTRAQLEAHPDYQAALKLIQTL